MLRSTYAFRILLLAAFAWLAAAPAFARAAPESFADLVEKLSPAVVNISTSQKIKGGGPVLSMPGMPEDQQEQLRELFEHFGMPEGAPMEQEVQSLGSGFVIDPAGYIVTNNHVVDQAEEVTVRFQDETKYKAKAVGRDGKTDLALLKIAPKKPLPTVRFGDSDAVRVGDWALAIGNPYGLGGTVTAGIISARSRHINAGPFDDFLQTDAAINRGNSGGPMFNADGEVIGVNTAIFSPTGGSIGIGFAIPAALAQPVLAQLREYGRTHRGWLGVKIQQVTEEVAESVSLGTPRGALVLEVTPKSPAARSGFKAGDVILSFAGRPIKQMVELPRIVAETKIGTEADVVVWREGRQRTMTVKVAELDESKDAATAKEGEEEETLPGEGETFQEMRLKALDDRLREELFGGDREARGVVVLGLEEGSEAAKRGIQPGDVIASANQKDVTDVASVKAAFAEARASGRKFVLVRILRDGDSAFVTLPAGKK